MAPGSSSSKTKRRWGIGSVLTHVLAIYGAVLSTILAVQQFSADRKDVEVQAYMWGSSSCPELAMAVVQILNTAKRPVTVTSVDLETVGGRNVSAVESRHVLIGGRVRVRPLARPTRLPKRLEDGEVMRLQFPAAQLMQQLERGVLEAEVRGPEIINADEFFESFEWLKGRPRTRDREGCRPAFYGL